MEQQPNWISKEALLNEMEQARSSLVALITSIPIEQAGQIIVYGELSPKDVLAHLATWANIEAGRIESTLDGTPLVRASVAYGVFSEGATNEELVDRINARVFEQNRDRDPGAVFTDFRKAHARLVAVVERLSDSDINDPQLFDWLGGDPISGAIAGDSYEHYREHEELIRQGLQKANMEPGSSESASIGKDELLSRMSEGYNSLMAVVNSVDERQATEQHVYGELKIKDVLAHLAGWVGLEAGWLEASLRGEPVLRYAPGYILDADDADGNELMDRLNEHIFQQHRDQDIATIRDTFQAAHSSLLRVVEQISEADLNSSTRFKWWPDEPIWHSIAGNSYEHYREHEELIRKATPSSS